MNFKLASIGIFLVRRKNLDVTCKTSLLKESIISCLTDSSNYSNYFQQYNNLKGDYYD